MKAAAPGWLSYAGAETEALIKEARRRQHRRYLLIGLAIIAVLAGAAGVTISQIGPGGQSPFRAFSGAPLAGAPANYLNAPPYYAYAVGGDIYNYIAHGTYYIGSVPGRYIKVRATATGKLLARISPPKPWNDFSLLTADADGRLFVFGAWRDWDRGGNFSRALAERNLRTPMKFLVLRITPAGGTQFFALSLPERLALGQTPSIALSPDGTRLAVAFGGGAQTAVVQVITLATGHVRQWVLPHTSWISAIEGEGAWTANGRTLALVRRVVPRVQLKPARPYRAPGDIQVRLLDTTAPGTSLASSKLLVLRLPTGESAAGRLIITPDGTKLIFSAEKKSLKGAWTGELAVYSARTGALLHTLARWVWRWPSFRDRSNFPAQTVAWSNRSGSQLIILQPRDNLNVLGLLTGNTFTPAGSKLLPQQPAGYLELQKALRTFDQMTW